MSGLREPPKRSSACAQCRARKVKCNGTTPCSKCSAYGAVCIFPESRRGKRKRDHSREASIEERLTRMEAFMRSQPDSTPTAYPEAHRDDDGSYNTTPSVAEFRAVGVGAAHSHNARPIIEREEKSDRGETISAPFRSPSVTTSAVAPGHHDLPTPVSQLSSSAVTQVAQSYLARKDDPKEGPGPSTSDKESSILPPQSVNWEHHGPGSWVSICSKPGVTWVSQRTGFNDFTESAREMTSTWTRRLKMDGSKLKPSASNTEPDPETAWKYSAAYFEESIEATFGVVCRPEFENALRAYFRGDSTAEDSIAWYALRQTVFAGGCRIYQSRNASLSFADIQTEAWCYFQGALSVLNELIFTPTGLLAVRVLVAMTYFVEGLGCSALEYMLCANAARLAQSKGLHRQPAKSWNLAGSDILHYNWLFWSVYCCEKQIAQRSGRPSAIDDDDISCQIPTETCPGSTIDIQAFTSIIRHAQIASQISKRLMSVKAFQQPPSILLETAVDLHRKLQDWKESLPADIRPADRLRSFRIARHAKLLPTLLIHCAYYGSLMAVHTIFAYPWISTVVFGYDRCNEIQDQINSSSNIIADAARNIILIAKNTEITGASTQWSTFYYPMIGLINLFIHILKYPTAPSVRSDVALLDVAAGYFGHMEYITAAELSFPFARDVAAFARKACSKLALIDAPATGNDHDCDSLERSIYPLTEVCCNFEDWNPLIGTLTVVKEIFRDDGNLNFDDWSIFSSVLVDEMALPPSR